MTVGEALPIWWSMIWRALVLGVIGGFVLGLVAGAICGLVGFVEYAGTAGFVAGIVAHLLASLWALKVAIVKHGLVPVQATAPQQ